MKNISFIVFIAFYSLTICSIQAQSDSAIVKTREIHLGIGPASYKGDLGNSYSSSTLLVSMGLKLNREKKLNGNVKIIFGSLTGQELDYSAIDPNGGTATPNTFFKTNVFGINYEAQYNFIDKKKIKCYFSQGIGLFRFNPKDQSNNDLINQINTRSLGESYRNLSIQLPTQIGAKYYLPNDFAFGLQLGFINPITDYLDNLGDWGNKTGGDNVLSIQFQLHAPISF